MNHGKKHFFFSEFLKGEETNEKKRSMSISDSSLTKIQPKNTPKKVESPPFHWLETPPLQRISRAVGPFLCGKNSSLNG